MAEKEVCSYCKREMDAHIHWEDYEIEDWKITLPCHLHCAIEKMVYDAIREVVGD
jgi:hypothetical protein